MLTGVARFARTEIDTAAIEQLARNHFNPLLVRVRSTLQEAPTSVVEDGHMSSREKSLNARSLKTSFAPMIVMPQRQVI